MKPICDSCGGMVGDDGMALEMEEESKSGANEVVAEAEGELAPKPDFAKAVESRREK